MAVTIHIRIRITGIAIKNKNLLFDTKYGKETQTDRQNQKNEKAQNSFKKVIFQLT